MAVEIIVIGNEILLGDVLDTNSHWLCKQLVGLGALVRRVTQIGDERETIADTLSAALRRGAGLVVTVGGLGPTEDDLTLSSVAQALGRPLAEHSQARRWVEAKYAELARAGHVASAEMTPARLKMAHLPQGAEPLRNDVGAAPGVLLRGEGWVIVCLPGVPEEMKHIVHNALRPTLSELFGQGYYAEWQVRADIGDESTLAPLLQQVAAKHPEVYIKSRARRYGADVRFTITLSTRGRSAQEVSARLAAAWEYLYERLAGEGIGSTLVEADDVTGMGR
ncbi:MAG: competence/damage-inducible protein A [Chloroflexi bacterium]|nr:competence/damage-inducible protein A [Chloroflexota bacterium]